MPNTYAHYRFGQNVKKYVNDEAARIIEANPDMFNIGVHGPDILAYYNPIFNNYLKRLGSTEHAEAVVNLLKYAAKEIRNKSNPSPYLAYMYGLICHFALDAYCHGYINARKARTGIGHNLMEAEFDRILMVKDGYNPFRYRPADTLVPDRLYAEQIATISPRVFSKEIYKSVKGMRQWCNFYVAPTPLHRALIYGALVVSGNYGSKNGMIIKYRQSSSSIESNKELLRLYKKAGRLAVKLINDYRDNVFLNKPYRKVCEQCFSPQESIEEVLDKDADKYYNKRD